MKKPISTINGIDIFELNQYGQVLYTLKKGWATIGTFYTIEEARLFANRKNSINVTEDFND